MTEKMVPIYRDVLNIHTSYVIGYNGAKCIQVQPELKHEEIFHFAVADSLFDRLFDYCKDLVLIFYVSGACITLEKHKGMPLLTTFADITGNPTWDYINTLDDARSLQITNALVILDNEKDADRILEDFRVLFANDDVHLVKTDCATTTEHQFYVEILNPIANKGKALEQLCKKLDIHPDRVIAFGDGENDREMLAFAGKGVCMKNACPNGRLKKEAKYISSFTNNEEGVHRELQIHLEQLRS
jgi:hydroxymethylpyrimidine pyrophosphatase-like HAD family hydrolase